MSDSKRVIGITGSKGFLAWHLACSLKTKLNVELKFADRAIFSKQESLDEFVADLDVLVHLAGVNRADEQELLYKENMQLAEKLTLACDNRSVAPHILFSSSTHIHRDSLYGKAKRDCAQHLQVWATEHDACFTNLVMPNVYGERGKPFYNSVVSTFCHQLANNEIPKIDVDAEMTLTHAQDVSDVIWAAIETPKTEALELPGDTLSVTELLERLVEIKSGYDKGELPNVGEPLTLRLFNTYRSYLYPEIYPVNLVVHADERGGFYESIRSSAKGQTSVSTTVPGVVRGDHFHLRKVERFLVIKGEATIAIRRLFDDKVVEFQVSGDEPVYIDIPTLHTHNIINTGDDVLFTLFWVDDFFNPEVPDTFVETV